MSSDYIGNPLQGCRREELDLCNERPRILGDGFCDDDANNKECNFDNGDCCVSDESSFRFCTDCECKEPGNVNVGKKKIRDSSDKQPTTGFQDCGKRLSQRDPTGLGQSNGQSVSTLEVIMNHILFGSYRLSYVLVLSLLCM